MKSKKHAYLILVIAIAVFNVIAFVAPIGKTAAFWIAYAFTNFAFVIQPLVWTLAFKGTSTLKVKFLGIPAVQIGTVYMILQIIAFAIICAVSVEAWISTIISTVLLGVALIGMVAASFGKKVIIETDDKVKEKVSFIKTLQMELEMIFEAETNPETKSALQKLVDSVRYSDPVSNNLLADVEKKILIKVYSLKTESEKEPLISEINALIVERNNKCKNSK